MRLVAFAVFLFGLSGVHHARAQDAAPDLVALIASLDADEKTLLTDPDVAAYAARGETARWAVVDAPGIAGGKALRVSVEEAGPDPWSTEVTTKLTGDVAEGDVVFVAFLARAMEADNESQNGIVSTYSVQQNDGEYKQVAEASGLVPLGDWRIFHGWGRAGVPLTPGTGMVGIHLGATEQVIDIGPSVVVNLGPDVDTDALPQPTLDYAGRADDAPWRAEALARVEAHRVGPLTVRVVDASGAPVPGAQVRARMTRSAFGFGTFVGHRFAGDTPDDARFRARFYENFNLATAPLYWQDWGWENPTMKAQYLDAMALLQREGVPFRGHPLVWPVEGMVPGYVLEAGDEDATEKVVLDHVREKVTVAAPFGPVAYDVYNEPHAGPFLPSIAGQDIAASAFAVAEDLDPDATLYINDYGMISGGGTNEAHLSFYESWVADHLAAGAPIGGIGFQGHFGAALTHPARIVEIMERFSAFGLPLQITEFDVDTQDEVAKADYLRDAMIAAYSVPAVDAFLIWGFWEGDHWRPRAALVSQDWTPRPAWQRWLDMQAEWSTDETVRTGADGTAGLRGYHGDYAVEVTAPGGRVGAATTALAGAGGTVRIVLD